MTNDKTAPVKRFQAGAVFGALWKNTVQTNEGASNAFLTLTLDRRFKDKDGTWRSTSSLHANDVPKAILVLTKAYEYMVSGDKDKEETDDTPHIIEEVVK